MTLSDIATTWTLIGHRVQKTVDQDAWDYLIDDLRGFFEARHRGTIVTTQTRRDGAFVLLARRVVG